VLIINVHCFGMGVKTSITRRAFPIFGMNEAFCWLYKRCYGASALEKANKIVGQQFCWQKLKETL
jgi:hypothetical protein